MGNRVLNDGVLNEGIPPFNRVLNDGVLNEGAFGNV